jgi:hypothetical protein
MFCRIKNLGVIVILFIVINSCRNDVYVPGACYNQTIKPLIISNCTTTGCHNSIDKKKHLDLTTYAGLMKIVKSGHPLKSELYNSVTGGGEDRMPPDHSLTNKEINLIKSWISLGARENDCPPQACDSLNVGYSNQVVTIINKNCISCHNTGNVILNNYNDLKARALSGALLGSINQNGTYRSMPESYKLSACDIKIIEKWVNAGAPNN